MSDLSTLLPPFMMRVAGAGDLSNLTRLSGGANMESWAFDWGGGAYVLRRAPSAEYMEGRPYGHPVEAALVRAAHTGGVKAPEVIGVLSDADGMGTGYVMRRVIAEVSPAKILAAAPRSLVADLGRELALIHALPRAAIPAEIPVMDTAAALAELKVRFLSYGGDRPAIALAVKWCEDHLPEPADPVLVHGDYRMGNIMVDGEGLAVVLDWELAHLGDAHEDLAFGCMTVWRFGMLDKPAFGVGSLDDYFAAYEAAGGRPVALGLRRLCFQQQQQVQFLLSRAPGDDDALDRGIGAAAPRRAHLQATERPPERAVDQPETKTLAIDRRAARRLIGREILLDAADTESGPVELAKAPHGHAAEGQILVRVAQMR